MITLVNGQPGDQISIHDRGLAYGDGVFETMLSHHGVIPLWERHLARLTRSLEQLKIQPYASDGLLDSIKEYLNPALQQIIKLTVTRGRGPRGYAPPEHCEATTIVTISERAQNSSAWQQGIPVTLCNTSYSMQTKLAGLKHLNRLEHVLASMEFSQCDFDEGIMFDSQGMAISATRHNLFLVTNSGLLTPDLSQCGVAGVMRDYVMEIAQDMGYETQIENISRRQLLNADELFLTNGVNGVWPIRQLDSNILSVGAITSKLQMKVAEVVPYCE